MIQNTVEPVLTDPPPPIGHRRMIFQVRWSLVTGSIALKFGTFWQDLTLRQVHGLSRQVSLYTLSRFIYGWDPSPWGAGLWGGGGHISKFLLHMSSETHVVEHNTPGMLSITSKLLLLLWVSSIYNYYYYYIIFNLLQLLLLLHGYLLLLQLLLLLHPLLILSIN